MNFFELLPSEKIKLGDVVYKYDTNQRFNTDLLCIADSEEHLNKSKFVKVKTKSINEAEPGDAFVFKRTMDYDSLSSNTRLNPKENETRYITSIDKDKTIRYGLFNEDKYELGVQPKDVSIISTIKVLDIDALLIDKEKIIVSVENSDQLNLLLTSLYANNYKAKDNNPFNKPYLINSKSISFLIRQADKEKKIFGYSTTKYYSDKNYIINKFEDLFPDVFDSNKLYECLETKDDKSSQQNINQTQNKENKMQNLQEIIKQIFGGTDYSKKPKYLVLVYSPDESICAQGSADSLESIEESISSDYRLIGHKVVAYKIKAELESKIPVTVTKIKKKQDTETQEPDDE